MIFILGGNGFVGSAFTRLCETSNREHRVITRANYSQFVGQECDIFINANGNSSKLLSTKDPLADFEASVTSVRKSLLQFKAKKYVFLSTCDVYPNVSNPELNSENVPIDISQQGPYGFHKYLAEQIVRNGHPNWVIFRMGGFVGLGLKKNAIFDILNNDTLWLSPDSELQFINTDDAARIMTMVAESKGICNQIYNLCGRGTIRLQTVIDQSGKYIKVQPNSPCVTYNVNVTKLQQVVALPETEGTVINFIQSNGI